MITVRTGRTPTKHYFNGEGVLAFKDDKVGIIHLCLDIWNIHPHTFYMEHCTLVLHLLILFSKIEEVQGMPLQLFDEAEIPLGMMRMDDFHPICSTQLI